MQMSVSLGYQFNKVSGGQNSIPLPFQTILNNQFQMKMIHETLVCYFQTSTSVHLLHVSTVPPVMMRSTGTAVPV